MTEKELIRAEIERRIKAYKTKNGFPAGTICAIRIETYEGLLSFINSLPEEKPSEDVLDAAKDALLLERAWLTLDGFGHEELAGRLRQFAERKGLIWK